MKRDHFTALLHEWRRVLKRSTVTLADLVALDCLLCCTRVVLIFERWRLVDGNNVRCRRKPSPRSLVDRRHDVVVDSILLMPSKTFAGLVTVQSCRTSDASNGRLVHTFSSYDTDRCQSVQLYWTLDFRTSSNELKTRTVTDISSTEQKHGRSLAATKSIVQSCWKKFRHALYSPRR